jgi:excinuclease ABC subunit A
MNSENPAKEAVSEKQPGSEGDFITITRSSEHNLKAISLRIPLNRLTLVCGVSGSGKSTLAHDVLFCEGQGRFLESFSAYARIFQARMNRSRTDAIAHIPPALALGQRLSLNNPRSTVGTLTDLHSPLRMLFSRFAQHGSGEKMTRSHLSFNHPLGACPLCQGLGQIHEIDIAALITDENRSLRQGALSLSTPNGYIIYSQVTIDVLDQVCRAHGFTVDIPWQELSAEQKQVVLFGSDRVRIPFGKHPLASRLKWTGITPKPRELGIYRGIVPIMEETLHRDPNPNILRFCRQRPCPDCGGLRLAKGFLAAAYHGTSLRSLLSFTIAQLADWGKMELSRPGLSRPEMLIISGLTAQARLLQGLSLGHLAMQRSVPTLSRSEGQRIQIANLLKNPISGMLYVLDEPGSGLHPFEKKTLYRQLRRLVAIGSTVVMVSHDRQALQFADWVVELGPVGGAEGGHLLFCGSAERYNPERAWSAPETPVMAPRPHDPSALCRQEAPEPSFLTVGPLHANNLSLSDLTFPSAAITAVSGVSGSGKSTLLACIAGKGPASLRGERPIRRIISVDPQPLGRTARSNPATYTKLFDDIRKLFAAQPDARELGLSASSFSFNTDQGCCSACQGAGVIEITMHYLQSLFQTCPLCQGRRYQDKVLTVRYQGLAIDEVLDLTITQALEFFSSAARIAGRLKILSDLGLGYLTLGQPSSTLSGGEAQRVRLASFIRDGRAEGSLYLLDEPCMGLHDKDIPCLVLAMRKLRGQGATLVVAENNPLFIASCDWLIELSGTDKENKLLYNGALNGVPRHESSLVAAMLAGNDLPKSSDPAIEDEPIINAPEAPFIRMSGVRTHNLQNISVSIPERSFTVVNGPSGSGKSSLALETLYKTCQQRYAEQLSPFLRDRLALAGEGDCDGIDPLKPAVALAARYLETTPRSTVGTLSGINDTLRVLFSRLGVISTKTDISALHASHFSFNHQDGACPACKGLGSVQEADIARWLVDPEKGILDGAFSGEKLCQFFLEPHGRFMAVLQCAAKELAIDIQRKWRELSPEAIALILEGSPGNFAVTWKFRRGERGGEHHFESPWIGLKRLVLQDYQQKKEHRKKENRYEAVVFNKICPACRGLRLHEFALQIRIGMITMAEMLSAPLTGLLSLVENNGAAFFSGHVSEKEKLVCSEIMPILFRQFHSLNRLGIGYLTLSRAVDTLSSGEHQRLRLASLLANRLNYTLFILDEMSRGLHPLDIIDLLAILRTLLPGGNTIVAIDHHPLFSAQADWIIRLGPGSGRHGGQVLYMGAEKPAAAIDFKMPAACGRRSGFQDITIAAATVHNLKNLDLSIPAEGLTVLCGVSGSGKSTLLHRVIHESAVAGRPVNCSIVCGLDRFKQIRSFTPANPVRYGSERLLDFLGVSNSLDDEFVRALGNTTDRSRLTQQSCEVPRQGGIRALDDKFSLLKMQKIYHKALKKALTVRSAASSCGHCDGKGERTTDLDYLGSFTQTCSHCRGSGLSDELCRLQLQGESLADVLACDFDALSGEIVARCKLVKVVSCLQEFALGYLSLGRRLHSLSGGELQRLRLARLYLNLDDSPSLLLLDEPDSGLSSDECRQLIGTMKKRLSRGHAAIVISHHPLMMCAADYLVDLGPGAGEAGGKVTACGSPRELVTGSWPLSKTAAYLKQLSIPSIS